MVFSTDHRSGAVCNTASAFPVPTLFERGGSQRSKRVGTAATSFLEDSGSAVFGNGDFSRRSGGVDERQRLHPQAVLAAGSGVGGVDNRVITAPDGRDDDYQFQDDTGNADIHEYIGTLKEKWLTLSSNREDSNDSST